MGVLLSTVAAAPPVDDARGPRAEEVAALERRARAALWRDRTSARPPYQPEPPAPAGLHAPPGRPADGVGTVRRFDGERGAWRVAFADGALPLRYEVDPELATRFGLEPVVEGMAAWDDIPGSRWRTRLDGLAPRDVDEAHADGVSSVFLARRCPAREFGHLRWQLTPGSAWLDVRYGTGTLFVSEVDIAICPVVRDRDALLRTLVHEVGHALGQAHVCERGGPCPHPAPDQGPDQGTDQGSGGMRCRVMFWALFPCGAELREPDADMARHLYPTLPRLWGPEVTETAARAAYVTVRTHSARHVLLARQDAHPWLLAPAVVAAAREDAPLLLGTPDPSGCVRVPAGTELARAAAPGALVTLVGGWPPRCDAVFASWGLRVERLEPHARTGAERMAAMLEAASAVADPVRAPELVLAPLPPGLHGGEQAGERTALAWAAAAVAGARGVPLVLVSGAGLPSRLAAWLRARPWIESVHLVGGVDVVSPRLAAELRRTGLTVRRWSGAAPEHVAVRLAELAPPRAPLLVAPLARPAEQAVAAALAARVGGVLAFAAADDEPGVSSVLRLLRSRRPLGGAAVGHPEDLPAPLLWAFTEHVLAARDPRLIVAWRPPAAPGAPSLVVPRVSTGLGAARDERVSEQERNP